jgi:hypothetical protein
MILVILFRNTSKYPYSKDTQQLPSEITPRRTVEMHPSSTGVPLVRQRLKVGVQTLAGTLIDRLSPSIVRTLHSIFERLETSSFNRFSIQNRNKPLILILFSKSIQLQYSLK